MASPDPPSAQEAALAEAPAAPDPRFARTAVWIRAFDSVERLAWVGAFAFLGWKALDTFGAFAGESTALSVWLDAIVSGELTIQVAVPWGLAAFLTYLWRRERRLRHVVTERLSRRTRELERRLHPGRTSSNLTARGTTNPEDRAW